MLNTSCRWELFKADGFGAQSNCILLIKKKERLFKEDKKADRKKDELRRQHNLKDDI